MASSCPEGRIPKMGTTGWRTGWWCQDDHNNALNAAVEISKIRPRAQEEFERFLQKKLFSVFCE
jgi:hypothetical protein